jgi:hypothetical protein
VRAHRRHREPVHLHGDDVRPGRAGRGPHRGNAQTIQAYNDASNANNFHPRLPRYGRLTHDQDRVGLTGAFQWRPTNMTLLTVDYLYSKLKATRQEDFLEAISFSRTAAQGGKPQTSVVSTGYGPNGELLYGVYNGVDIRSESRYDELQTTFTQPSITLEHDITPTLKLTGKVGYAESKFPQPGADHHDAGCVNVNGYAIDFRGSNRLPIITYPFDPAQQGGALGIVGVPQVTSGTQPVTVPNTTTSEIRIRPQGSDNKVEIAHAELSWEMNRNLILKGGPDYKKYDFSTFEFRRVNQNDTIFAPPAGSHGAHHHRRRLRPRPLVARAARSPRGSFPTSPRSRRPTTSTATASCRAPRAGPATSRSPPSPTATRAATTAP